MITQLSIKSFTELQIISTLAQTHKGNTTIYLCRYLYNLYVCKVPPQLSEAINKKSIINDAKAIEHAKNQKQAMKYFTEISCQYICKFYGTFQDQERLYILMQMIQGLPLHKLLHQLGPFPLRIVKLITIQISQILHIFHSHGYIYRDIKSSNFIMNKTGKITMIDLGHAKHIKKQRTYTICGTTYAMPPDVYGNLGYSYQFDYYSFGVLIYELIVGYSPFGYGGTNHNIMKDIEIGLTDQIMDKVKDPLARNLIQTLIIKQPTNRLGYHGGFDTIMKHQFFKQQLQLALQLLNGQENLSKYDEEFSQLISEIQDLGIDAEKYQEIKQDDPFYQFL